MEKVHKAWRHNPGKTGQAMYVAGKRKEGDRGDRYHYTSKESDALLMSEFECRQFCKYMKECATVGFWY